MGMEKDGLMGSLPIRLEVEFRSNPGWVRDRREKARRGRWTKPKARRMDAVAAPRGRWKGDIQDRRDPGRRQAAWKGEGVGKKRKREADEVEATRERATKLLWGGRRARVKDCSADFDLGDVVPQANKEEEVEADPTKLAYRKKQIEIGKNTPAYQCYIQAVPKHKRKVHRKGYPIDPVTPDINKKCSKRCFDGLLKSWRRQLHKWNPQKDNAPALEKTPEPTSSPIQQTAPPERTKRARIAPVQEEQEQQATPVPAPVPSIFDGWFEEEQGF